MGEQTNRQDGKARLHEMAIAALMSESSIEAAAKRTGITGRTLQTWLTQPEFIAKWSAAKRSIVQAATVRLRAGCIHAIKTLEAVQDDKEAPHAARVTAARTILELALRSHEVEELLDRLTALEQSAKGGRL